MSSLHDYFMIIETYLSCHDLLSLQDEDALAALAVLERAHSLVAL